MESISKSEWFSELNDLWPGQCFSLKIKEILHEETSEFQNIKVIDTFAHGRVLILDGIIQCSLKDEFSYQEMISFLPLCCHSKPEKVLIVGGGDGGVAREVVKHPDVKIVHQVEIDSRVVELSKKYFPTMACGFDSPKLTLIIGDGIEYLKLHKHEYDVIITDSSDPIGPAQSLFQENYSVLMKNALKPNGIICTQAGSYWIDIDQIKATMSYCRKHFSTVSYAVTSVPSYTCGQIGFLIASTDKNHELKIPRKIFTDQQLNDMNLNYYSIKTHRAAFDGLPRYIVKQL